MSRRTKTVQEYLNELRETKKEKPPQVKEALEIYIELWENAIKNGAITGEEEMDEALASLDAKGGLYRAADG